MTDERKESVINEILERLAEEDAKDLGTAEFLRRLGLNRLAREVSESRELTRYLDFRDSQDKADAWAAALVKLQETHEARLASLFTTQFEKASAYNQGVVSLGYAGLFAIWTFLSDGLSQWDNAVIGALLGLSLIVYLAWTVASIFNGSKQAIRVSEALSQEYEDWEEREEAVLVAVHGSQKFALRMLRVWQYVFLFAVMTGFASALLLFGLAFLKVLGSDFSLEVIIEAIAP